MTPEFFGMGAVRAKAKEAEAHAVAAKDLIIFNTPTGTSGSSRTSNNLLLQAGLGLTF